MHTLWQDARYGVRMLAKAPGFAAVAIATLALGIGANTALFSAVDAVLLKSLPYPDPSRVVLVWGNEIAEHNDRSQASATDVMDWRKQNRVFEDIATYQNWTPTLTGRGEARRIAAMRVGDGYFGILRAKPLLGRTFTPEENIHGKESEVVLSQGFWEREMGGDRRAIGQMLTLNGIPHTIVGVLPASFRSLPPSLLTGPEAELYRPVGENYDNSMRSARHLRAIARLRPGVTIAQAQSDMNVIAARLSRQYPAENTDYAARVVPMKEDLVGGLRPALLTLFGAVVFVLLIACANVANLLLARSETRQREVAVRAALGAGAGRLRRQFLTESVLLALAGGGGGILLAVWGTKWIGSLGSRVFPALNGVEVNGPVLLFTFVIALATGVLFGIAPAERAARMDIRETLNEGGRSLGSRSGSRLRNLLLEAEIALALVLAAGAGLMTRSVIQLYGLDPGFATDHLLTMDLFLPAARYPTPASHLQFNQAILARIDALAGVETAGTTTVMPLSGNFDGRAVIVFDKPRPAGQLYSVDYYAASPGYFQAMRIPLVGGRYFTAADRADTAPVVIVGETMARTIWPGEGPIGKRVKAPGQVRLEDEPWSTVVGVVKDAKQWALDRADTMQLYGDESQVEFGYFTLAVRTKTDPAGLAGPVRRAIQGLDPDLAVSGVATMQALVSDSIALRRLALALLGAFAGLALLLACFGTYGVISYVVAERTQEFGVRMAFGAESRDVLRLVTGLGARLAAVGIAAGLAGSLLLTRLLAGLLYGVSATDGPTLAVAVAALGTAALAACYIPARRAMRLEPMVALRHE